VCVAFVLCVCVYVYMYVCVLCAVRCAYLAFTLYELSCAISDLLHPLIVNF